MGFKVGDRVFGRLEPGQFGSLGEFVVAAYDACAVLPDGLDEDLAAGVGTAGLTAYQTIVPNVKEGDRVFINGGSGSVGTFGIQIAKAVGCHISVSCSTGKIEACKLSGADEVIDYTKEDVTQRLVDVGLVYSLVVIMSGHPRRICTQGQTSSYYQKASSCKWVVPHLLRRLEYTRVVCSYREF